MSENSPATRADIKVVTQPATLIEQRGIIRDLFAPLREDIRAGFQDQREFYGQRTREVQAALMRAFAEAAEENLRAANRGRK